MLLIGHRFIPSKSFYHIHSIESISNTPASSTIYINFDEKNLDIIEHAKLNQISIAIAVTTVSQVIYASSLQADYIVVEESLSKVAQQIANEYLFDAKILALLENEQEIEPFALAGIDGVIFSNAIIKTTS